MIEFVQQMINGLSLGSIYALVALGYTMVYGIIKLINFAHGDIYMVGAFLGFVSITYFKLPFFVAIVVSMVLCAVLGVVIEKIAYKPLRNAPRIAVLITAIGVSFFLEYLFVFIFGADIKTFPPIFGNNNLTIGSFYINYQQILIFTVTITLMLVLQFIVKKSKMGKAMQAVSSNAKAASLMGISVDKTISFTFALSGALAGVAGVLVGVYYNSINPLMGMTVGLKAFIAAVFGGIGNIPGAMIGGYFIGVIETLVSGYGSSLYKDAVVYALLIIILIVKPAGLLGKKIKEKV
ncbi:MAG: branched-chain amino acid ABC transporter permease [Erysipelotrichaceae bacterium]